MVGVADMVTPFTFARSVSRRSAVAAYCVVARGEIDEFRFCERVNCIYQSSQSIEHAARHVKLKRLYERVNQTSAINRACEDDVL